MITHVTFLLLNVCGFGNSCCWYLHINSMLTVSEDITEWIWKIAVDSGNEIRYFDLLHGKAFASAGWTEFATYVTPPAWVRGAASIDLFHHG